jgi:hypothetical protein
MSVSFACKTDPRFESHGSGYEGCAMRGSAH